MLFTSFDFALFLPIVFFIYWVAFKSDIKAQNITLLLASYVYYGWWDWRFLFLLLFASLFNYFIGIKIDACATLSHRKSWLITGLFINLGLLGLFKYFDFFIEGFIDLVTIFGYDLKGTTINIILPLGISFYTFLSLSYLLDIYKKELPANKNIIHVMLSLSFFPIILAGPIQRPATLLPQIRSPRIFNYDQAVDGLRQILWGLFVKIAVADNMAHLANDIFLNYSDYDGSTLMLGALYYTIQIYADFSGYSHIAIGTASILGFRLMKNFNYPYFARDITEFWKKWHISLTTWFRDYLFLPISFAVSWKIRKEKVLFIRTDLFIYIIASLITWFLTGLWHGANYTFILWGLMQGFLLTIYQAQKKPRRYILKRLKVSNNNQLLALTEGIVTFLFIVLSWVVFRSDSILMAIEYIKGIFLETLFHARIDLPFKEIAIAVIFIIFEYFQRDKNHALQIEKINQLWIRWGIYIGLVTIILLFGEGTHEFIYFEF
jgi:D-alanyl-lipoteichoic acid acyltransferase DltB (MBOAT superfamily)